ncbi:MAG: hypothetical protein MUO62_08870, partial [Anaerolineales bacterium]|nr:hypothetical protein [Anaerolineales bacterium]
MENKDMIRSIETVSMNAWPALREEFYDGWVLRFSKGYTKRANSVNVLGESSLDLAEKISTCEAAYQREDLAAIFRLTPLSPPDLDGLLESRGYRRLDPTGVMTLDLREWIDHPGEAALLQESSRDAWLVIHGE